MSTTRWVPALLAAVLFAGGCANAPASAPRSADGPVVGTTLIDPAPAVDPNAPARLPRLRFGTPMPIPPVLQPTSKTSAETVYDLIAQKGTTVFFPGTSTETYGYNGSQLGPTLRLRRDEQVAVRIENRLSDVGTPHQGTPRSEVTNVHWHGLRIPAAADGPHHEIAPGETFTARFKVDQPAATFWYHPHTTNSGFQVWKGLAGFLLVDDAESDALSLPRDYGVNDFPLMVQDKHFETNGELSYRMVGKEEEQEERILGERIAVNGVIDPHLDLPQGTVRLRLLNGSDARRFNFAFEDGRAFFLIGSDGSLLDAPVSVTSLLMAPAERAEILVDFSRDRLGSSVKLVSLSFNAHPDEIGPFVDPYWVPVNGTMRRLVAPTSNGSPYPVMELRVTRPGSSIEVPRTLLPVNPLPASAAQTTRTFEIEKTGEGTINGMLFDMKRVDIQVRADATEIWSVTNYAPTFAHSFHVHGLQFNVLDRTIKGVKQTLPPLETGWKDTVVVHPDETVRLIANFHDLSGLYMFHCHVLQHEDQGMMGTFLVTPGPGTAQPPPHPPAHADGP